MSPVRLTAEQRLLLEQLRPICASRGMQAIPELVFAPPRKWRIDVALLEPEAMPWKGWAIEIDGGVFVHGRHSGGMGQVKDMEKLNALTEHGWWPLKFTPRQVMDGTALAQIRRCL